jgi:hypothetical protein
VQTVVAGVRVASQVHDDAAEDDTYKFWRGLNTIDREALNVELEGL